MPKFNEYEIQLGKALGFKDISSANDKAQIAAFAKQFGVSSVNSAKDVAGLIPNISKSAPTLVAPNEWKNPNDYRADAPTTTGAPVVKPYQPPAGIPAAASNGSSSNSSFKAMMMQMNQQIAQQQQVFAMQQKEAQMASQAQSQQMQEMMAKALDPVLPPAKPADSASGWKDAGDAAKKEIEALLLTSTATPSALNVATPGALAAGSPSGKDLAALMIA